MSRPTIKDIAERAGVSKGAVSYALNGRPGVSERTRERILAVAAELGWHPNRAARLLSGSRADAYGLVLSRDPAILATEPFYMQLIAGIEQEISTGSSGTGRSSALLLQVTPDLEAELATYRQWWSERRVDAVIVVDLRTDDPRIRLLAEIGLPALLVTNKGYHGDHPAVIIDDHGAMVSAVDYLTWLGHRRIARVSGIPDLVHVQTRDEAFIAAMTARGLSPVIMPCDFTAQAARDATTSLINSAARPTAIIYDNDVMAVAGLGLLVAEGIAVPAELSVLAWDDSPLCELTHPQLSALSHDVMALGRHIVHRLDDLLAAAIAGDAAAGGPGHDPVPDYTPTLRVRGSTAPPVP